MDDLIAGLDARARRRRIVERGDHGQLTKADAKEFVGNERELDAGCGQVCDRLAGAQFADFVGRQKSGVRVERGHHALNGAIDEARGLRGGDVTVFDVGQHLGEARELPIHRVAIGAGVAPGLGHTARGDSSRHKGAKDPKRDLSVAVHGVLLSWRTREGATTSPIQRRDWPSDPPWLSPLSSPAAASQRPNSTPSDSCRSASRCR